ncbi:Hsp20/alpha crystallin family protein [Gracilinema caldarium]|uniref:Heat shock protein Hsp20 n=1 Tax=Gracilinema caldarium (strain ATCC 51460 / DSM 7334 / H1) TaxID=744872 RepID=F8EYI1_GRAC1|nr:Hsp20/alpha crystallin family protein [Gracilinema caldarium]AEJ18413.1 heat shock protein Hsp20 [Gracilinema caldarium DSM 7334]
MNALSLYRPVTIQNALDDFDRLINSFFGESPMTPARTSLSSRVPAVDVRETDEGYVLEAELPGYDEKSVEVHVDGQVLTIESKKDESKEEKKGSYLIHERYSESFRRSFTLPDDVDSDSITATFKNGLLTLNIKKRPESRRKLIKIEG